jgi:hypothetical protein
MNSHFRTRVMQQKSRAFSMLFFWREILDLWCAGQTGKE